MSSINQKIPVTEVAGAAIGFAFNNFLTLIRIGWFPILLSSFLSYVGELPAGEAPPDWITGINPAIFQVSYVLAFVCWAVFAVSVHRMILVEQEDPSGLLYFRLTVDEIRYALAPLVIGIIPIAIIGLGAFLTFGPEAFVGLRGENAEPVTVNVEESGGWQVAVFLVSLLAAFFVYIRLLLSFPIIAAEHKFGLLTSWSLTSGNFWRMILVYIVLFITLWFVLIAVTLAFGALGVGFFSIGQGVSLPDASSIGTTATIATVATTIGSFFFLSFLMTVIFIAVLSFMYQALTDEGLSASERMKSLRSDD